MNSKLRQRNVGLDIIRSVAILIVLFQHSLFFYPKSQNQEILTTCFNLVDGVSIFFVLSGFLIGTILIRDLLNKPVNSDSIWIFWKRRWLRTIPSYYLVMTIVLLFSSLSNRNDVFLNHLSYYFFLQNIYFEISKFYPEAWSLSIEEWFYFLFPLVLVLFKKLLKKDKSIIFTILLFLLVPILFRFSATLYSVELDIRKVVVYRLDAIAFGVLMAYLKYKSEYFFKKLKHLFFGLGLILLFIISTVKFKYGISNFTFLFYSLESFGYCLLLPLIQCLNYSQKTLFGKLFYFISTRSYLLYLVNLTLVLGFIMPFLKKEFPFLIHLPSISFLLFWIINLLLAEFIYRFFERPILVWRDHNVI